MTPDIDAILRAWAEAEASPWRGYSGYHGPTRDTVVSFAINGTEVVGDRNLISHLPVVFEKRLVQHEVFLNRALSRIAFDRSLTAWIDLGDEAVDVVVPTFSFQKQKSSRVMLLPDAIVDPPWRPDDDRPFEQKETVAFFIGSTTGWGGKQLTLENFEQLPRIQAATAFLHSPDVEFRLPSVVQCDDAVRRIAQTDPRFAGGPLPGHAQLLKKFVISIDGNGATCSRVTTTLWSKSVLLKYASDNVLFYFKGLQPGVDYIPISDHQDVVDVVQRERAEAGTHAPISHSSSIFAERFLSEDAVLAYTGHLMMAYADAIGA